MKRYGVIVLATVILSAAYGMMMVPLKIVNGGVTSFSMVLSAQTGVSILVFTYGITLLLLFLCVVGLGKRYAAGSLVACAGYLIFFALFNRLQVYTGWVIPGSPLAVVVLAGMLVGIAYGVCLRHDATIVGFDTVALLLQRLGVPLSVAAMMFIINTLVLLSGVGTFGWRSAAYGIVFAFVQSAVIRRIAPS